MSGRVLLKRVGIGLFAAACATLAGYEYLDSTVSLRDARRTLDIEMDQLQELMETWGGANWSPRRYGDWRVMQAWFIKVDSLSDRELANAVHELGGYDTLTNRKNGLRMSVTISSAPASDWRIAQIEIDAVG